MRNFRLRKLFLLTHFFCYVDGHYLNLPVMNETGEIVGMVDVLKLTYATLEQVRSYTVLDLADILNILTLLTGQYDVYRRE